MSGPQFLGAYLVALAVTTLAAFVLRSRVGSGIRDGQPPSTVEEIAYLNGDRKLNGPARVIASTTAGLLERGLLRMSRDGRLQYTAGQPRTDLEARIVDRVRQYPDRSWINLVFRTNVDHVETALIAKRLLTKSSYTTVLLAALPLLAVTATGIVRIVNGLTLDRPVEALAWPTPCNRSGSAEQQPADTKSTLPHRPAPPASWRSTDQAPSLTARPPGSSARPPNHSRSPGWPSWGVPRTTPPTQAAVAAAGAVAADRKGPLPPGKVRGDRVDHLYAPPRWSSAGPHGGRMVRDSPLQTPGVVGVLDRPLPPVLVFDAPTTFGFFADWHVLWSVTLMP